MEWFEKRGLLITLVFLYKVKSANKAQIARAIPITHDTLRSRVIPELEKRQLITLKRKKKFPWSTEIELTEKGRKIAYHLAETGIFLETLPESVEVAAGNPDDPENHENSEKTPSKKNHTTAKGPFDYHAIVDLSGKVMKAKGNWIKAFEEIFGRMPSNTVIGPTIQMTEESRERAFGILRESICRKNNQITDLVLTFKNGAQLRVSGTVKPIGQGKDGFPNALEVRAKIHHVVTVKSMELHGAKGEKSLTSETESS